MDSVRLLEAKHAGIECMIPWESAGGHSGSAEGAQR